MAVRTEKRRRFRWIKPLIAIAAIAGLFAWYYYGRIAPVITTVTEESVKMKVSEAIDDKANFRASCTTTL